MVREAPFHKSSSQEKDAEWVRRQRPSPVALACNYKEGRDKESANSKPHGLQSEVKASLHPPLSEILS